MLANDLATAPGDLSTILVSGPARGNLWVDEDGHFVYTSPRHFNGMVNFSYAATDGATVSEIATVQIKFGRKQHSLHKVGQGNELEDFSPRHPASHDNHIARESQANHFDIFPDEAPAALGFEESVFNGAVSNDSHWLFG